MYFLFIFCSSSSQRTKIYQTAVVLYDVLDAVHRKANVKVAAKVNLALARIFFFFFLNKDIFLSDTS